MGMKLSPELEKQILAGNIVVKPHIVHVREKGMTPASPPTETIFEQLCVTEGIMEPVPEYQFAPPRKWRFDWAWPERMIALEIDGVIHRIKDKFARDMEKSNAAQLAGWVVLRCTPKEFKSGEVMNLLKRAFEEMP